MSLTYRCELCGQEFHPARRKQRFCTKRCAGKANSPAGRIQTERFLERIAAAPRRRIGDRLVYLPDDGPPFILSRTVDGRPKRRRGELRRCARCGSEYFWSSGARGDQSSCSRACAGKSSRKTKHAKSVAKGGPKKDALDKWFSLIVRSAGSCNHCGSTERLQCAHIVSRRYLGVRYAFDNAMCLCAACHMRFTHRPLEWEEYVISLMGEDEYRALKRRALAFVGPFDRAQIAEDLYALAREKGVYIKDATGWPGWTGLTESKDGAA